MTLLAPSRLWLLVLVAGLAGIYVWLQHRRRHRAVRFSNLELLRAVAPKRPGCRRHVPAAGVALSMAALTAASDTAASDSAAAPPDTGGAAVVLLSDGVRTVGSPVEAAAQEAAERGIPVSTIAFGTGSGTVRVRGEIIPVPADPETMARVAELTSGEFFEADSTDELKSVYEDIGTRVGYETTTREASGPGLMVAYLVIQRRRRRDAGRFANPALLPLLVPHRTGWWRHALTGLFIAGLMLATVGAAQPTVPGEEEREQATIMVAIDTSDSMAATDVRPDRITAAVSAAKAFVGDLPSTFHVGLVTASASPVLLVAPTTDHLAVQQALDHLELHSGTALGEAIFTALAALPTLPADPVADAEDGPAASIVLLSDGVTTTGRPDSQAIAAAVEARVPVSTIAFGTSDPDVTVESAGQTVKGAFRRAVTAGPGRGPSPSSAPGCRCAPSHRTSATARRPCPA